MPSLPVPIIISLILIFLFLRGWRLGVGAKVLGLIALLAVHAAVVFARYDTVLPGMAPLLALFASLIGPATWLVFDTSTRRAVRPLRDALHLALGPLVIAVLFGVWPRAVDPLLSGWFLGHGVAILVVLAQGGEVLSEIRLGVAERARGLWAAAGVALILTGFVDLGITLAVIAGQLSLVPWIVTASSAGLLVAVAAISMVQRDTVPPTPSPPDKDPQPAGDQDGVLIDRLRDLLTEKQVFRDPDLTLGRLARRLHVPAKQLSAAINRATGENVSRLVNSYRVQAACEDLASGHSVTQAMLASGFATKSNFNAEFKRVTGAAPRDWLRDQPVTF